MALWDKKRICLFRGNSAVEIYFGKNNFGFPENGKTRVPYLLIQFPSLQVIMQKPLFEMCKPLFFKLVGTAVFELLLTHKQTHAFLI